MQNDSFGTQLQVPELEQRRRTQRECIIGGAKYGRFRIKATKPQIPFVIE
jgi:hypothetical protein